MSDSFRPAVGIKPTALRQIPNQPMYPRSGLQTQPVVSVSSQTATLTEPMPSSRPGAVSHFVNTHRKQLIILGVVLFILVGVAIFIFTRPDPEPPAAPAAVIPEEPAAPPPPPITSNLTGVPIQDPGINARPVTGVMIENSPNARPQSGMDQAGVVFEAIAEGGVTRFLALYQEGTPDSVGPVRSIRPYYAQWCLSFDCAIAHVGGSPEGLQNIRDWGVRDLDQFAHPHSFWRTRDRFAPHNMYTSMKSLNELEGAKNYGQPNYTPIVRKPDSASPAPNASSIDINISSGQYNSHYDYDAASNSYKRSQGGAPHMTVSNGGGQVQLQPKVIVAMVMPYGVAADKHSSYGAIGAGQVFVFQDGTVTGGTWHKPDLRNPITFTDSTGAELKLNAGQTWFVALSGPERAVYR